MAKKIICGIYKITNPIGQIYIGYSKNCLKRWRKGAYDRQTKILESFDTFGFKNHLFEILEECEIENLGKRERYWVKFYDTFDTPNGLNLTNGDNNKYDFAKETKEKLRTNSTGNKNWVGKTHSEVTKEKMSESQKGKIISDEAKLKMSIIRTGKKASEETKKKMSEQRLGKSKPVGFNKHLYKMVLDAKTSIYYESLKAAANASLYSYDKLQDMLSGKRINTSTFIYVNQISK